MCRKGAGMLEVRTSSHSSGQRQQRFALRASSIEHLFRGQVVLTGAGGDRSGCQGNNNNENNKWSERMSGEEFAGPSRRCKKEYPKERVEALDFGLEDYGADPHTRGVRNPMTYIVTHLWGSSPISCPSRHRYSHEAGHFYGMGGWPRVYRSESVGRDSFARFRGPGKGGGGSGGRGVLQGEPAGRTHQYVCLSSSKI